VFLNVSPQLFGNLSPEERCPDNLVGGADATLVANGCNESGAVGVCTMVQEFSEDLRARYDTYHYAAETLEGQGCRSLP